MRWRTSSSRISAPPPGRESRPASRSRESVSYKFRPLTSAMFTISGAEKQWHQMSKRFLIERSRSSYHSILRSGMQAALHQDAGAAQVDGFLNLAEDGFVRQDVAFGVAHRAVERAEAAVFGAEIGVVDVAVDDVADHAFRMQLAADGVGGHADADQVVALEHVDGFSARHHAGIPPGIITRSRRNACWM